MSDIDQRIIETIIGLLKDGGKCATIGVVCWFAYQILRITLIGGFSCLLIKVFGHFITTCIARCKEISEKRITLISKECSGNLCKSISDLTENTTKALSELKEQVKTAKDL
jgi:hypothetical protein